MQLRNVCSMFVQARKMARSCGMSGTPNRGFYKLRTKSSRWLSRIHALKTPVWERYVRILHTCAIVSLPLPCTPCCCSNMPALHPDVTWALAMLHYIGWHKTTKVQSSRCALQLESSTAMQAMTQTMPCRSVNGARTLRYALNLGSVASAQYVLQVSGRLWGSHWNQRPSFIRCLECAEQAARCLAASGAPPLSSTAALQVSLSGSLSSCAICFSVVNMILMHQRR